MKTVFFIFALFLLPFYSYSQICSANAGGDQVICVGDPMNLYGVHSDLYQDPLVAQWTSLSNPSFVIANPNVLQTSVSPPPGSTDFTPGDYDFKLCVTCQDEVEACNVVRITVGEITTPAEILTHDTNVCGNTITLVGSTPDPGATGTWIVNPSEGISGVQNGNSFTLTHNSNTTCSYMVKYIISLGTCDSIAETNLEFTKPYTSVFAGSDATVCGLSTFRCGTRPGCGGTPEWTVVSSPAGGVATISNANSNCSNFTVDIAGDYCFKYTIENGICTTAEDQVCFTFQEGSGIDLGPDEYFEFCEDEWDIATWDLAVPDIAGATYYWRAVSSMGSGWITFSSTNTPLTTVMFAGTPVDISANGLLMTILVTAIVGECSDTKFYRISANPTVELNAETVPLLCGGDEYFRPAQYIGTGPAGGNLSGTFVNPPVGSPYMDGDQFPINASTQLNLTYPGTYILAILVTRSGIDPVTEDFVNCKNVDTLTVIVADIPTINAGSDILTCATTIQLNGSTPLDVNGDVVAVPILWEQIGGPPGARILSPNTSKSFVTGLAFGATYTFQYSFSKDPNCYLVDAMTVTIRPQEECCTLNVKTKEGCEDGCVVLSVEGAESYQWTPATGIDDPTSATPKICTYTGGLYTVFGKNKDGEVCASALVDLDPCPDDHLGCNTALVEFGNGIDCQGNSNSFSPENMSSCLYKVTDLSPYNGNSNASCQGTILCVASTENGWDFTLIPEEKIALSYLIADLFYPINTSAGGTVNKNSCFGTAPFFPYEITFFLNGTLVHTVNGDLTANVFVSKTIPLPNSFELNPNDELRVRIDGTTTDVDCDLLEIGGLSVHGSCPSDLIDLGPDQTICVGEEVELNATVYTQGIIIRRVEEETDDAEENSEGKMSLYSLDLELVEEASTQTVGIRFNEIFIPQGAMITNAYIQFVADEFDDKFTDLIIHGENTNHALTFVENDFEISNREKTYAGVAWSPEAWYPGDAGLDQESPDLAGIVQELVNKPEWDEGNSIAFIISGSGKRVAESTSGQSAEAPLLVIEYEYHNTDFYTYLWSTGATTESITANPSTTTTYFVTVTDARGCMDIDEVTITVEDCCKGLQVAVECTEQGMVLSAYLNGDLVDPALYSVQWVVAGVGTPNSTNPLRVMAKEGSAYSVKISGKGLGICQAGGIINCPDKGKNKAMVFPNPSIEGEQLFFSCKDQRFLNQEVTFTITNEIGLAVKRETIKLSEKTALPRLNNGVYLIHIINNRTGERETIPFYVELK